MWAGSRLSHTTSLSAHIAVLKLLPKAAQVLPAWAQPCGPPQKSPPDLECSSLSNANCWPATASYGNTVRHTK